MDMEWICPQCGRVAPEDMTIYQDGLLFNPQLLKVGPWCTHCGERVLFHNKDADPFLPTPTGASPSVMLLSGTCASGKTTLSYLMSKHYGAVQIDGDWMMQLRKSELGRKVTFDEIHLEMLMIAEGLVSIGKKVVISHVILPESLEVYDWFFNQRGITYVLIVLMPSEANLLERNYHRTSWPTITPEYWVKKFNEDLLGGPESFKASFYDNSHENPEQTARNLWEQFCLHPTHSVL